ncbi:ASC1-like protein isoform X2 [Eucalyptus grandis]|uniref:ASC1-like protein isoform X2 n=1 Tax=Eucalyptus grandis TaxID=71139 RepID=UPI00192E9C66|nr:ASC1-like protein isoform X2 [Eucalyptus grandis]
MGSWIDWSEESYPSNRDFAAVPFFALFFPAARLFLDTFIFEKLARRLIFKERHAKLDFQARHRRKKINKFKESAWKCVYFLSAEIFALSVSYDEPWFTSTKYFWAGPGNQVWPDQKIKLKLKGLYMYASGFYIYSLFALVFWETRRSDFVVSMGHHVASILLLVLSYMFRFARVGSIILALHDASDVFMEVGKMSNYEILPTLDKDPQVGGPFYYYVFNTLLFCLLVLHLYWWWLLCGMLVNQVRAGGQISEDIRSDSEGDDDHRD